MVIKLVRGDERIELEGDDTLIHDSLPYSGTWERLVKEVTSKFYGSKPNTGAEEG